MAVRDIIKRHMLIMQLLRKKPSSFEEISDYLESNRVDLNEKLDITKRTFDRDRTDMLETWGVAIEYNKQNMVYEIVASEQDQPEMLHRAIEHFDLISALKQKRNVGNTIFLEKRKSSGSEHFKAIGDAIEDGHAIRFSHQSYNSKKPKIRFCVPKAIKEAQGRFYLVGYDLDKRVFRNYGLDRILDIDIVKEIKPSPKIDIEKYYEYAFGIECDKDPVEIVLEFEKSQYKYVESIPFHKSQVLEKSKDGLFRVTLFMYPTHDFLLEIMKYGPICKVLAPESLKMQVIDRIKALNTLYEIK